MLLLRSEATMQPQRDGLLQRRSRVGEGERIVRGGGGWGCERERVRVRVRVRGRGRVRVRVSRAYHVGGAVPAAPVRHADLRHHRPGSIGLGLELG